jgi:hypothetical protein
MRHKKIIALWAKNMTDEERSQIETAEDLAAEKTYTSEVKEDAVREEVIKEYGFDTEADKEKIEKAVKREMDHRVKLSKAVGQKIKYRGMVPATPPKPSKDDDEKDFDTRLQEGLDKRELDDMEYPDTIKDTIKRVAKINGTGVKKALADPYVAAQISAWKKENGADDVALGRGGKQNTPGGEGDVDLTPPNVDLSTEEGRKTYDAWKEKMKAAGH